MSYTVSARDSSDDPAFHPRTLLEDEYFADLAQPLETTIMDFSVKSAADVHLGIPYRTIKINRNTIDKFFLLAGFDKPQPIVQLFSTLPAA